MRISKSNWIGIILGVLLAVVNLIFFMNDKDLFTFLMGIAVSVIVLPFVVNIILENKREQEIDEMFLEFTRNLAESVNTGTPISKSIINMSKKNYGSLDPHIKKLANQIALGISVNRALETFANDVGSKVIKRAVGLISQAERAGGEIDYILDSVAKSIAEVEKLKNERKAAISNLVVQGYIIFFIFIGIMLVMEFKIIPLTTEGGGLGGISSINNINALDTASSVTKTVSPEEASGPLLYLLLAQGFFTGLVVGKLSEGNLKAGIKHSFILTVTALLVSTGARLIFG